MVKYLYAGHFGWKCNRVVMKYTSSQSGASTCIEWPKNQSKLSYLEPITIHRHEGLLDGDLAEGEGERRCQGSAESWFDRTALVAIHPQLPCGGWRFVPYDDCGWTDLITTIVTVIRDYKRSFSLHYQYTQLKWTTIHFHSRQLYSRVLANRERVRESSGEVPELLAFSPLLYLGKCFCNKVSVQGFFFDI